MTEPAADTDVLAAIADALATWTLDLSLPQDHTTRWGHLSPTSCRMVTECVRTVLDRAGYVLVRGPGIPHGTTLEPFTKFRQRHERGRIDVMQHGEMWMDGEWLWRVAAPRSEQP